MAWKVGIVVVCVLTDLINEDLPEYISGQCLFFYSTPCIGNLVSVRIFYDLKWPDKFLFWSEIQNNPLISYLRHSYMKWPNLIFFLAKFCFIAAGLQKDVFFLQFIYSERSTALPCSRKYIKLLSTGTKNSFQGSTTRNLNSNRSKKTCVIIWCKKLHHDNFFFYLKKINNYHLFTIQSSTIENVLKRSV